MNQVFLSYASADRERARQLAEAMARRGYRVWWDRQIAPGQTFDEVIEKALDESACVVVLWSSASVKSQWVKTEAAEAASRRILVPARIENVKIPLEFRRMQAADLTEWTGDAESAEFQQFLRAVDQEILEHREALSEAPTVHGGPVAIATPQRTLTAAQAVVERAPALAGLAQPAIAESAARVSPPANRDRRWVVWVGASIAVAVTVGGSFAWIGFSQRETPDVVGMAYEQAAAALTSAGLSFERREQTSTEAPGRVVAQNPTAGSAVARGTTVSLTVATAAAPVVAGAGDVAGEHETAAAVALAPPPAVPLATIPDLRGKSAEQASALLAAAELTVGATTEVASNEVALGTIVAQDPAASQTIAKGSPVGFSVAARRTAPELTGLNLPQAQEQLTKLGLSPRIERVRASRSEPDDRVLRQAPAAGSEVAAGGEVDIVVATVPPKRVSGGEPLLYTTREKVPDRCSKACQAVGLRWTREWNGTTNTCTCDLMTPTSP